MSEVKVEIIFEDHDLLVLNKPAGLVVNNSDSAKGVSLQDWVVSYLEGKNWQFEKKDWEALVPADFSEEYGTPEGDL
jgi:23S rRNA-/tRNA-specific pseudouridylate synthase